MGQKRRFVNLYREILREFASTTTFVDLFGGSGLLSHITKRERPGARVIYNDYDDYHLRIENVDRTNAIIADIQTICRGAARMKKVDEGKRHAIIDLLREYERTGFVDYVTISSSILFSSCYATSLVELQKQPFYNTVKQTPYTCKGFLDGLEIVKYDYRELFERCKSISDVAFIVDPPYLSTQTGHYKNYWKIADYLNVFETIRHAPYIYFTSNKSEVIELFEWMDARGFESPFKGAVRKEMSVTLNYSSKYTDIMLYKCGK